MTMPCLEAAVASRARYKKVTLFVDRGSILLIVYSAFSAGVVAGVWQQVGGLTLTLLVAADIVLLAVIIGATVLARGRQDSPMPTAW